MPPNAKERETRARLHQQIQAAGLGVGAKRHRTKHPGITGPIRGDYAPDRLAMLD